ncbi:MAG: SPASM domain-containing protein [Candidatus Heimdallarchaeota archaeon]|nr:SPASM domain-containing protein [Candidatus Heimdallarchaeota archaeon]
MNNTHKFKLFNKNIAFNDEYIQPPQLLDQKLNRITSFALDISGDCNLNCIYCAEKVTMPSRPSMSIDLISQVINLLFKWSSNSNSVSIHLGSGEPLMKPDIVREIGQEARKLSKVFDKTLHLYLTTNGLLITDEIYKWLIEDGWGIKISIDGNEQIHDRNRRDIHGQGTFQKIAKITKRFAKDIPDRFSATAVFCKDTNPAEIFNGIAELNVPRIEIVPVAVMKSSPLALTKNDLDKYRDFINNYAFQLVNDNQSKPILAQFIRRIQRVLGFKNKRVSCGAGRNYLGVDSKGRLFPCARFIGLDSYYLGNIVDGIDDELVQKFVKNGGKPYNLRMNCQTCWAATMCGGPCFACAELLHEQNGEPSPDYCSMVKAECEAAIWLTRLLQDRDPEKLISLLGIKMGAI